MVLSVGVELGPYKIIGHGGVGGMGEVYRARDTRLDRDVAIKVLPQHLSENPKALKRFQQEAKALAALSHPNILTIYDIGTQEGLALSLWKCWKAKLSGSESNILLPHGKKQSSSSPLSLKDLLLRIPMESSIEI